MSSLPKADQWTGELTSSNRFWTEHEKEIFKNTHFLIAGCGSIGNPIAEKAVMMGAINLTVADPDRVELSNLSRQRYNFWQVGKNKAQMTALNLRLINPVSPKRTRKHQDDLVLSATNLEDNAGIRSIKEGITLRNVDQLVRESNFVVDAVDIRALDIIFALHKAAAFHRKPVIVGYDMAGTAMVAVYRYDLRDMEPLEGALTEDDIVIFNQMKSALEAKKISESEFLDFIYETFTGPINPLDVPIEQFLEILDKDDDGKTPQSGTTATALSAISIEVAKRIINGEDVKNIVAIDLPSLVRRKNPSILTRLVLMAKTLRVMKQRSLSISQTILRLNEKNNDSV